MRELRRELSMDAVLSAPTFGDLLRAWRAERRLSQAALAHIVDTPPRHVSFLETGRSRPSRGMIARLATALQVPLRERALLFRAAGFADGQPAASIMDADAGLLRDLVERLLTVQEPYPAFAIDRLWRAWDMNAPARALLNRVAPDARRDGADQPVDLLDLVFSPDGLRPRLVNWRDCARHMIQRLHRETPSAADLRAALDRVRRYPDLPEDWWAVDVTRPHSPVLHAELDLDGRRLSLFSVIASLAAPLDPLAQEMRVEILFPSDAQTAAALEAAAGESV